MMGKMIVTFILFTVMFASVIVVVQALTKRERWRLTKWLGFSIMCSLLAVLVLSIIVFLF